MLKRLLLWILGYGWLVALLGAGLLGMAGYSAYSASQGGKIPPEAELTVLSGHILEGRTVTVERKRRRGGRSTTHYYELDLKPGSGDVVKLKVDYAVPKQLLASSVDEDVTVKFDPNDDNMTYVIQRGGQDVVPYAKMAELSKRRAEADKTTFTSAASLGAGAGLLLIGSLGFFWRRRLIAADRAEIQATTASMLPAGGIGSQVTPLAQQGNPPNSPLQEKS